MLDKILTARFRSGMRNISIVQCYAPSDTEEKGAFYAQFNAVREKLPEENIAIVMGDLNGKVSSDNTLPKHVMEPTLTIYSSSTTSRSLSDGRDISEQFSMV